ncbi:MAG: polyribonucleotide nucleotidyltransferase [SAR202 cluster bacterium]|nr:polyribonucleotide nucleotidyltransferase [SAR202 cluster bacterium]|tara:strand:- start:3132 stop:5282 length:2151 start_codon:yes stop_codon:yes gene_type:complete
MSSIFTHNFDKHTYEFQTGTLAKQANGSVLVNYGDCSLLVTATMSDPREGVDFFPLTVEFSERMYARGKIPGGFFRREGRPGSDSILICRLIDRPIRPIFPKGFRNEVQVVITPLSVDLENPVDIPSLVGTSLALSISDIPFSEPISACRVGYIDGKYVINPSYSELECSELDIVVAGSKSGITMLEAGATEVSEQVVLEAIKLGQLENEKLIKFQHEIMDSIGKPKIPFESESADSTLINEIDKLASSKIKEIFMTIKGKQEQATAINELESELKKQVKETDPDAEIQEEFEHVKDMAFRDMVLTEKIRPDGRGLSDIRPLDSSVGFLPRTHGSSIFERGETQAIGIVTLGSEKDALKLDTLSPQESKHFMFHYNFPPFSVGETGRIGVSRRDTGHGALAERALEPILPPIEEFPYTIRVVSEVVGSNGSTSMASTCAGTLALMDAGVPIKSPVAGISIGLVANENGSFEILTDIQGLEDHAGDMDFKVAGTKDGITAIQLDIKISSIGYDIIEKTLEQAKSARFEILDNMKSAIDGPRNELSQYAPRVTQIQIPTDKIGLVIGPGGKTIRGIIEETGATVDIQDDGTVLVGSSEKSASEGAIKMIEDLTREAKVGDIFTGKVVRIMDFGAFVQILPGKDGMIHISEIANYRVDSVEDEIQLDEEVTVIVKDIDKLGRIALSRKALLSPDENTEADNPEKSVEKKGKNKNWRKRN